MKLKPWFIHQGMWQLIVHCGDGSGMDRNYSQQFLQLHTSQRLKTITKPRGEKNP